MLSSFFRIINNSLIVEVRVTKVFNIIMTITQIEISSLDFLVVISINIECNDTKCRHRVIGVTKVRKHGKC